MPLAPDIRLEFYKPRRFVLESHPLDYETVIVFAIETGLGLLVGIGMEHLNKDDPTRLVVDPPRQGLLHVVFQSTFDFHRRTFPGRPARLILEAIPALSPEELRATALLTVIQEYYGEAGMAAREAAIYSHDTKRKIDVLEAEPTWAQQFKITCDAMASRGYDSQDVLLWFGLRQYAFCRSTAETKGKPVADVADRGFADFSYRMGMRDALTVSLIASLCQAKGLGRLEDFPAEQLDRFLRGVDPPVYADIQEFVTDLRDRSSSDTITNAILQGGVSLAVYGRDHVQKQYDRAKAGVEAAGYLVDEIDWSPSSNLPRFLDRGWFERGVAKAPGVDLGRSGELARAIDVLNALPREDW
jgi:hypothetical protein